MAEDCTCTLFLYGMFDEISYAKFLTLLEDESYTHAYPRAVQKDGSVRPPAAFIFYDVSMGRMEDDLSSFLQAHAIAYVWRHEPVYGKPARQTLYWPLDAQHSTFGCLGGELALRVSEITNPAAVATIFDHAEKAKRIQEAAKDGLAVPRTAHERLKLLSRHPVLAQFANLVSTSTR